MNFIEKMIKEVESYVLSEGIVGENKPERIGVLEIDGKAYLIATCGNCITANGQIIDTQHDDCHIVSMTYDNLLGNIFGNKYTSYR